MEVWTLLIAYAITTCRGFVLVQNAPRKVVKILTVNNGGGWGSWHGPQFCADGTYAVGYNMKGSKDDTAANYIKFHCRDFNNSTSPVLEMVKPPGHGVWGGYGPWSDSCPQDSAVCGIQARIETPQGSKDDTGLNDIKLFCCTD